jgi:hypothetical protein
MLANCATNSSFYGTTSNFKRKTGRRNGARPDCACSVGHPYIREEVWALYHRGRDDTAVSEAMKGAEVTVQKVIRCGSTLENECRLACILSTMLGKTSPDQAKADRLGAEMSHVRIERLGARHSRIKTHRQALGKPL